MYCTFTFLASISAGRGAEAGVLACWKCIDIVLDRLLCVVGCSFTFLLFVSHSTCWIPDTVVLVQHASCLLSHGRVFPGDVIRTLRIQLVFRFHPWIPIFPLAQCLAKYKQSCFRYRGRETRSMQFWWRPSTSLPHEAFFRRLCQR